MLADEDGAHFRSHEVFRGDINIEGIREGTIIAAVFTGFVVKFFGRLVRKPLGKLLVK